MAKLMEVDLYIIISWIAYILEGHYDYWMKGFLCICLNYKTYNFK
jgi:hypothetical protein